MEPPADIPSLSLPSPFSACVEGALDYPNTPSSALTLSRVRLRLQRVVAVRQAAGQLGPLPRGPRAKGVLKLLRLHDVHALVALGEEREGGVGDDGGGTVRSR